MTSLCRSYLVVKRGADGQNTEVLGRKAQAMGAGPQLSTSITQRDLCCNYLSYLGEKRNEYIG